MLLGKQNCQKYLATCKLKYIASDYLIIYVLFSENLGQKAEVMNQIPSETIKAE